jgi:thiol-disulfide isomerase/thioredoxin
MQTEYEMKKVVVFYLVTVMTLLLFWAGPAFSENTVIPIDSDGVKKIIEGKDCPILMVATAAWCAPCRVELPILNKLYLKYKDKGLNLVAISLDLHPQDMQHVVDKLDLKFPVYWGGERMAFEYRIFGMPTILVVKEGKIAEKIVGTRSELFLEEKISELFAACSS